MKLIYPNVNLIRQKPGITGIFNQIEKCGRVCYKSTSEFTKDTSIDFVKRMIKSGHGTTLEHGTVYLKIILKKTQYDDINDIKNTIDFYERNPYSHVNVRKEFICDNMDCKLNVSVEYNVYYITTNFRVITENNRYTDIEKYGTDITPYHDRRFTIEFTCDIGVGRELNRHRVNSINEESTRYCNYTKDKFENEITYTLPVWLDEYIDDIEEKLFDMDIKDYCKLIYLDEDKWFSNIDYWIFALLSAEYSYKNLIKYGWKPQQARLVLNLNTKTTLVHTAFESDWQHFFDLRVKGTTGTPHPSAKEVAEIAQDFILNYNNSDNVYTECIGV